jgi:hypothetical protein
MGPHGYRLICLGASLSVPAPHSLRTANFGAVEPMCQSGGSCVCRAVLWLAIGLHTVQWAAEACLAAAGLVHCEFGRRLASYNAPTALEVCIEHCRGYVSGPVNQTVYKLDNATGTLISLMVYSIRSSPIYACVFIIKILPCDIRVSADN